MRCAHDTQTSTRPAETRKDAHPLRVQAWSLVCCPFTVLFSALASAHAPDMRVVLLGTGTPIPRIERFWPATLVEAGG